MTERTYGLYLESGPKMRKTMVHVPELFGCIANGPTTDQALEATPDAIRRYLRFLAEHGEALDAAGPFRTRVVEHVTEGQWLGNGDPTVMFGPDRATPTEAEIARCAERFRAIREDTLSMVRGLPARRLSAKPNVGRSIGGILEHLVEPARHYIRNVLGPVPKLDVVAARMRKGAISAAEAMAEMVEPAVERLDAMTTEERTREVPHGAALWTAGKMLRRLLEHEWEHHEEIRVRLGG
jgi:predicted RNase H-like HicB family nuclease/uncharacterized damage-inducible protein DinB